MVLMNDRDVLLSTTSLTDGGWANGIIFADPFDQHDKANQIKKNLQQKRKNWGKFFIFSTSTFQELSETGALDLYDFVDHSQLESNTYLDIATNNNRLTD